MGRIDYKSGLLLSVATIPGAIFGALATAYIPRQVFDAVFGLLMIVASGFLVLRPGKQPGHHGKKAPQGLLRHLVEADGTPHTFSYDPRVGVGLSIVVGYVSSLLGIGGGIIHVPVLVYLLNFPVHIATATSHFILAFMTLTGTLVHIATGVFHQGVQRTIVLGIGVLLGAQAGARLSNRVQGEWIIRGLATALGFVGVRWCSDFNNGLLSRSLPGPFGGQRRAAPRDQLCQPAPRAPAQAGVLGEEGEQGAGEEVIKSGG